MAMKKKPVTGMKDILPKEMAIRDYCIALIKETYKTFGFNSMETPCVEHIENLNSKQGGENEKLIFKILKRGEKLKIDEAKEEIDLVDGGLRYDLTVPLCRYYSRFEEEGKNHHYSGTPALLSDGSDRPFPVCPERENCAGIYCTADESSD